MCVARSEQELAEVGLEYAVADLGTPDGCAHAITETEQRLGPVEILVCNHGIGSAHELVVWEQDPEVWDETMRINLDGPFHLSRLLLKGMTERQYGCHGWWPFRHYVERRPARLGTHRDG
jgi:NAD(P)-dependent dehydrogenase (short-subunit alcohol dehydrogenase family)